MCWSISYSNKTNGGQLQASGRESSTATERLQ